MLKLHVNQIRLKYIFVVVLHSILYVSSPFLTALFINNVINGNPESAFRLIFIMVILYVIIQITDYFVDICEQNVRISDYSNLITTLNTKIDIYDHKSNTIDSDLLYQDITQNYELIKDYIIVNKINYYVYIIRIIVTLLISLYYSITIAAIMMILVTTISFLPRLFKKKLSINTNEYLKSCGDVQQYTVDHLAINEESRFLNTIFIEKISHYLNIYKQKTEIMSKFESFYTNIISYGLINGSILAVIIASGLLVLNGNLEIGFIYLFQSYISQMFSPVEFILDYKTKIFSRREILDRYKEYEQLEEVNYNNNKIETIKLNNYRLFNNNINLELKLGDFLLIKGGNGSGKTTLIKSILGINKHDNILINNNSDIYSDFVYISSNNYESKFTNVYSMKSSGEQRIDQISKFINTNKTVYIFDEPTNFIDVNNKMIILKLIESLHNNDKIIIVISHDEIFDNIINKKILDLVKM
jgi:ABC-type multidrug transport system fused ATPase/permease subunit